MPRWVVTETKTVELVHIIYAATSAEAVRQMQLPGHKGLVGILVDDFEVEYEVEPYGHCHLHETYDDSCSECYDIQYRGKDGEQ